MYGRMGAEDWGAAKTTEIENNSTIEDGANGEQNEESDGSQDGREQNSTQGAREVRVQKQQEMRELLLQMLL